MLINIIRITRCHVFAVLLTMLGPTAAHAEAADRRVADDVLRDAIVHRLSNSGSLAGTDIAVEVENRKVFLSGTVASKHEKERAAHIAYKARGSRDVRNNLKIDAAAIEARRAVQISDEELVASVANALVDDAFPWAEAKENWLYGWEVDGKNWEFDVEADQGRITLDGDVDSYEMIVAATIHVRRIPGVKAIDNKLVVASEHSLNPLQYLPYPRIPLISPED